MSTSTTPAVGQQPIWAGNNEFSAISFIVKQMMGRLATATLVQVQTVTNAGGVAPTGTISVLPLINQVDGAGNAMPHGVINDVLYSRLQGGNSAIILDPAPGDIGVCVFGSRDLSAVKRSKAQSNPGSLRRFSMADAVYVGTVLGAAPTQYVQFTAGGVNIVTTGTIGLQGANVTLDGEGNLLVKGEVTAASGGASVTLQQHKHGTGAAASGTTAPTPGT